jgi:hypothetical protein
MHSERIARLLADIDALGEALIAANPRDPWASNVYDLSYQDA